MAVQTLPTAVTAANTPQTTRTASFAGLLARFRCQNSDLDAAEDQDDIDRLASDSQDTLFNLTATRVDDAAALGDKVDALITRYEDFGTLPMDHVRQLLLDIRGLEIEPVSAWERALASYRRHVDVVARILDREGYAEEQLADAQKARNNAMAEMFATPVPTVSALAIKLDVLAADLRDFEPDETSIAYVVADAHRLATREG